MPSPCCSPLLPTGAKLTNSLFGPLAMATDDYTTRISLAEAGVSPRATDPNPQQRERSEHFCCYCF